MPRYFFDTDDASFRHHDNAGQELVDDQAARYAALSTLPLMASEHTQDEDRGAFVITVRGERGEVVYRAELLLRGHWGSLKSH